jgi:3-oxoadipate enol-lactonase
MCSNVPIGSLNYWNFNSKKREKMRSKIFTIFLLALTAINSFSQNSDSSFTVSSDTGYITVDGGKLFYETAGKGENIVLLHDGMVDREIWDEQFPVLAKNYKVVRYDRRTYGKSSDPQAPYSDIEDLDQVFIQLKIDKAIIFGMSSGGGLAIDFALKYPAKVSALVLVGAVVSGYGYSAHMFNRGGHMNPAEVLADPQKTVHYFIWDDPYEIYSGNIKAKEKVAKILENNLHNAKSVNKKQPDRPAVKFLPEIKVPTLVLVGEYDIPDVHSHAGVIESGIPGAKREIILKSGHLIPLEQPRAFDSSVLGFLKNMEFFNILDSQGVDAAVEYFKMMHQFEPGTTIFREQEMNLLGYRYLQDGKTKDAVKLFKINTIAYPGSWNVYDSLGEAYLKDGQIDLAIKNYEKSLEIDPGNENARKVLKELKGTK